MAKKRRKSEPPKAPAANVVIPFPLIKLSAPKKLSAAPSLFQFGLRGGHTGSVMVLGEELDRLWNKVQEPDSFHQFVVFDTLRRRIALNVSHIQWSTFEGAAIEPTLYLDGAGPTVDVLFAGESKVWQFDVEPDELTLDEVVEVGEEEEELSQLANLFFYLDSSRRGSDYAEPLVNSVGAITWLRLNDILLFSAPRDFIKPTKD
jgi:hypothetical protein